MYFSNLVGSGFSNGVISRNNGKSFPLEVNLPDDIDELTATDRVSIRAIDGKIVVSESSEGKDVFDISNPDFMFEPVRFTTKRKKVVEEEYVLTHEDILETEENPIVVVAAKGIRFYVDVPTYINTLFVNDDFFIVALIYGACDFEMEDGRFVTLARCTDVDVSTRKVCGVNSPKFLKDNFIFSSMKDRHDISFDVVCPIYVYNAVAKDQPIRRSRCLWEKATVIDDEKVAKAYADEEVYQAKVKAEKEAKEKALAEMRARNAQAIQAYEQRQKEFKEKQAAERKAARDAVKKAQAETEAEKRRKMGIPEPEKKVKTKKSSSGTIKKSTTNANGRRVGADAFLAFVKGNN